MDKTFCIFGDSVTQAAYVKNGWVDLLRGFLEEKYDDVFINVFNLGVGGNTTQDVLNRFVAEATSRNLTDIIFAVGVNDSAVETKEKFAANIEMLIGLASKITSKITFVGLVQGEGNSEDRIYVRKKVARYNSLLKGITEDSRCRFIELFNVLDFSDFSDGLHPNDQGHLKMFEVIKKWF